MNKKKEASASFFFAIFFDDPKSLVHPNIIKIDLLKRNIMKVFGLLLTLVSINAFAANKYYEVAMDLSLNGKRVATPRILVKNNVTETVRDGNRFYEVTAIENPIDQSVKMDFTVGEFGMDGQRIIISRPTILTKENTRASIMKFEEDSAETIELSAVPIVKNL